MKNKFHSVEPSNPIIMTKEERQQQILDENISCTCDIGYKSRNLADPNCPRHSFEEEIILAMEQYASQQGGMREHAIRFLCQIMDYERESGNRICFDERTPDELYDLWLSESPQKEEGEQDERPKIVCFCGSTRFAELFMIKRWELEKQGIITFGINILPDNYFAEGNSHGAEQEGVKDILDELHKRKIDLSDEVFILNVGGYIGESTRNELNYAIDKNKKISYLEPPK